MPPESASMLRVLLQKLEGEGSRFSEGPDAGTLFMTVFEHRAVNPPAVWRATDHDTDALVKHLEVKAAVEALGEVDEPSAPRAGLPSLLREVSDRLASVGPAGALVEITATHVSVVGRGRSAFPPGSHAWRAE